MGIGFVGGFLKGRQLRARIDREKEAVDLRRKRLKLLEDQIAFNQAQANRTLEGQEALGDVFTLSGPGPQQRLPSLPQAQQTTPFDPQQARQGAQRRAVGEALSRGVPLAQTLTAAQGLPTTPPPELLEVSPGATLFDPMTQEPVFTAPTQPRAPRTPFQALTQMGMDPFDAFVRLETQRERIRAQNRQRIRVISPEGTEISIGPPAATGELSRLTGAQQLGLVNQAENIRRSLESIQDLRSIVERDPNAFGLAANIRQTVSSAITEGVRGFEVLMTRNEQALAALSIDGTAAQRLASTLLSPETSRADYLFETLVFELARALNNQGRLSDADVRAARRVLSGRIRSTEDLLPRLAQMITQLARDHASLRRQAQSFQFDVAPLSEILQERPAKRQSRQETETPVRDDLQNMTDEELKRQLGIK